MTDSGKELPVQQTRRVRIGMLGCSEIGRRRFLPALRKAANAELAGVASRDPARARQVAREFGCAGGSYEALLASPGVDLVYISLPNHLHEEWTLKSLDSGKHVICEKPLGLTLPSVERMTERARRSGLLLVENTMHLHHPQHRRVKDLVEQGAIGRVRALRTAFGFRLPPGSGFRLDPARGGGAIHDLIRYPLSIARFFLKDAAFRFAGFSLMRGGLDVATTACAATASGVVFSFTIGFEQQYECWYELIGEQGVLRVDRAYTTPADLANTIELTVGGTRRSVTVPAADHFTLMIEHACELVRSGFNQATGDASLRLARLAEQVRNSCTPVWAGPEDTAT